MIITYMKNILTTWYGFENTLLNKYGMNAYTLHCTLGSILGVLMLLLTHSWILGLASAIVLGILKEALDWYSKKGGEDLVSALYTGLGGIVSVVVYYLMRI